MSNKYVYKGHRRQFTKIKCKIVVIRGLLSQRFALCAAGPYNKTIYGAVQGDTANIYKIETIEAI